MTTQRARILAIDDTPSNLVMLGTAIGDEYELQLATSGPIGLALAADNPPDLILLDIMMPDMDGYETFRRLAAQPRLKDIPVIFVTALDNLDSEITGLQMGAADYITKPIMVAIARQRIRNLLERERLRKEIQAQSEQLRQLSANLRVALDEKVALLKEVHHRVKNNLQVVASLLRLEGARSSQTDAKTVLADLQGRVGTMAILHESLYRSGTLVSLDLGKYIRDLATQVFRSQLARTSEIRLRLNLDSTQIGMDQAVPCGLLLNELISNCLKHGFPEGRSGDVEVELQQVDSGPTWRLCVSDTGVGLPADFDEKRKNSLGLQLVDDLSEQLGGTLEIGPGAQSGAAFALTFIPDSSQ